MAFLLKVSALIAVVMLASYMVQGPVDVPAECAGKVVCFFTY